VLCPRNRLAPESLAVPVTWGHRFDLDIARDFALTRQSQFVFVADVSKLNLGIHTGLGRELFDESRLADVFLPLLDEDAARAAQAEPRAVQKLVDAFVDADPGLHCLFAEVSSLGNVDRLFFFDEGHFGHVGLPSEAGCETRRRRSKTCRNVRGAG
jgi:hypothetical protein